MIYKTLRKVTSATKYEVVVFDKNGNYYDEFTLDYTGDKEGLDENILKSFTYEKCSVRNVSTYHDGSLYIGLTYK